MFDKKAYMKEYWKKYSQEYKEEIKQKKSLYWKSEKGKENSKKYYKKHREEILEKTNKYKQENKDKVIALRRKYQKEVRNRGISVWEQHYGEVSKGDLIIHIDGNKNNNDINNLMLITKGELGTMNIKNLHISSNVELTKTNVLIAKLMNKTYGIKKRDS